MAVSEELRRAREEIVVEHMESENRHEFDVTLGTFDHPRYELIGTGDVYDGPHEVARYFEETRAAFPDQRNELIAMHHSERRGDRRGKPLRHRRRPIPRAAADGAQIRDAILCDLRVRRGPAVCERVYFDSGTILRQLGIARDPLSLSGRVATVVNHPVTIGRAVAGQLFRR